MLVTVGDGGATGNQNWWRLSNGTGSVSADSDVEIDNSLVINRVLWHQSDQLRFFRAASGSFALAVTASGVLAGKSVLVAVNDTGDAIDAQWDLDTDSIDAIGSRLGLNTNTAQTALFNAVATGDLVNIVISDVPGTGPPAVVHDIACVPHCRRALDHGQRGQGNTRSDLRHGCAAHGWGSHAGGER